MGAPIRRGVLTRLSERVCRRAFSSTEAFLYEFAIAPAVSGAVRPILAGRLKGDIVLDVGCAAGTATASPSPRPPSRTPPRRTPAPASPPPSSPWPTPQPDQRKHRDPPRKGTPPDRGPGRPRHDTPAFGIPAGRRLPAVTKNRNYPQPVKHLKPVALGRYRRLARTPYRVGMSSELNRVRLQLAQRVSDSSPAMTWAARVEALRQKSAS